MDWVRCDLTCRPSDGRDIAQAQCLAPSHGLPVGSVITAPAESTNTADGIRTALDAPPDNRTISGTLSMLDVEAGKGILTTDLDKTIFFRLTRPDLFVHLSIGDRITIQLDDEGQAVKVIEVLPAQVHEPPPPPK